MATILNPDLLNRVVASTTALNSSGTRLNATTDPRSTTYAPPKASAAVAVTNETFSGLVNALNAYQARLVKQKKYEYPDQYVIEFCPADLADKQLKKPSLTNPNNTAMQSNNSARNVLSPATNSVDYNSQGWQIRAGMQIVQFIDQVVRSSSYITDQQSTVVLEDGTCTLNAARTSATASTAWYKISAKAEQLQYDYLRHDHAYRFTYTISPYAINQSASQFFPDSQYRGSHKSYNYWFTGQNSQIIDFEQEYNHLYRLVISGIGNDLKTPKMKDFRDQFRRTALPTSAQLTQGGQPEYINGPGDGLADFLYSIPDQAKVRLNIVGDPAWLQQGEIYTGFQCSNFGPFNADGGINYDSQQVVFDVSWNQPEDYNFDTGVVDLTRNKYGEPKQNLTYTATFCKSMFSKGRFTQELQGRLLVEYDKTTGGQPNTVNGRPQNGTADLPTSLSATSLIGAGAGATNNFSLNNLTRSVNDLTLGTTPWATSIQKLVNNTTNPVSNITSKVAPSNPSTQPAAPPEPPTSNSSVESTNGNTPQDQTDGQNTSDTSQQIAQDDA